ncbi:MAG: hypothetical protein U0792_00215 [Gemmataceae bacterium]
MKLTRFPAAAVALLLGVSTVLSQPKEEPRVKPPRTEKVDVQIRYRIRADRDERVRQFRGMEKHLAAAQAEDSRKEDPDRDLDILDPNAERLTGTIASAKVLQLLDDPRIQNILFSPSGFMVPEDTSKGVPIRVILRGDLIPTVQQVLHLQVLQQLESWAFAKPSATTFRAISSSRERSHTSTSTGW